DMPMVQQLEKMRLLSKQPMPSIDSLDALINQALAQEWTCEVCGAKTKGLNCEYCDTPRKKVSFFS
ncbi:MAG: hypothetical protein KBT48_05120, partial [Firmicutes bacterium]|nr:hypothetical protein [Bacillota bacterium]